MLQVKNDSITDDFILNSKHTTNCSSKEFQIAEECNCWRVEFAKHVLAKQESKKTIYVASKTKFAPIWKKFRSQGYPIVSSWLDEANKTDSNLVELWKKNIEESNSCGVIIYFAEVPTGITSKKETVSNGGLVEVGSALSNDVPVIWAAMEYPTVCRHPNIKFVNGCEDTDHEMEIEFALNEAMKILKLAVPNKITQPTLAQVYLNFIQTRWDPKYNFGFGLDDWKKNQTIEGVQKYLDYFKVWFSTIDKINNFVKIDKTGKQYFNYRNNCFEKQWWEMNDNVRHLTNKYESLYTWDSFVAWCWEDELPRKTFNIELKEEDKVVIKVHEQPTASISSVEYKETVVVPGPSVLGKTFGVQNIPVVQMTTITNNPKARKLNRIKTHSSLVRCTNKSRRTISLFPSQVTCGHCLKLGKKKGLWV